MSGCSSDSASHSPTAPVDTSKHVTKIDSTNIVTDTTSHPQLATQLVGSWNADSSVKLMGIDGVISMQASYKQEGTFESFVDASLFGNAIQGHLFTESGIWIARSADSVLVKPTLCAAADTLLDPKMKMILPFHSITGGFQANDLKPSACPDSMWITTHPVHDTLRLAMPVTVPGQGRSLWTLAFHKLP